MCIFFNSCRNVVAILEGVTQIPYHTDLGHLDGETHTVRFLTVALFSMVTPVLLSFTAL